MTNKEISKALSQTANLIELTGGNSFRARALASAARTLRGLDESVEVRLQEGTLTDIDGIGDGLAAQIEELLDRGSFELRDDLLNAVPPGLPSLLSVKGLGVKKIRQVWKQLDITSLDELEEAAISGKLVKLDGFGAKTQENILTNVRLQRAYGQRRRLNEALAMANQAKQELEDAGALQRITIAGDIRRNLETVAEIQFVASVANLDDVDRALKGFTSEEKEWPYHVPAQHFSRKIEDSFPLHLAVVPHESFGTALWYGTGSKEHCIAFERQFDAPENHGEESEVFAEADLPFIPPEIRENSGELDAAKKNALPDLITKGDLQGTLHNHSTYSDGAHTLETMAEHARKMGLSYFGICDHSQSLTVASGLSIEEVDQQQREIEELNAAYAEEDVSFKVFSGIESDILADGSLDYPDDVLETFDFVVASVHSRFGMSREAATQRLITAISNPHTSILGHATGRLLLIREGYRIDHDRVIEACAQHDVAIELNANPHRLDMDWRFLRKATDRGVLISINPDAHSTSELAHVKWGVAVARKAWLTADQCLNAFSLPDFEAWISR